MQTGDLDCQITVERKQSTVDATYGTEVVAWVPLIVLPGSPTTAGKLWAQFRDVLQAGSESVRQNVVLSTGRAIVRMRYRSDMDSSMRVTRHAESDIVYQIISNPAMIGRKQWLEFVVEKYSS